MIYTGIDVSSKSFVVYAVNNKKKKIFDNEIKPTPEGLKELMKELGPEKKYIVFEAGNQMKWICQTLLKMKDVIIHVVHPNEIKWINQSSGKTDKIDARKLAELARGDLLPRKVHIVEGQTRKLRELASARNQLQSKRVSLINTIRGYLKQEGYGLQEKFFNCEDWKEKLQRMKISPTLKTIMETFMLGIEGLKESEKMITDEFLKISDERIDLIESIPCIGKISSRVIVSAIDDAKRFDSKKCVAKYTSLTPRIYQSGNVVHMGRIDYNGRREVRKVLLQCAHTITRTKTLEAKPLKDFFERISKKRGKKKAIVALARKLIVVAYGVLKNGSYYDPQELEIKAA